MAFVMNFKPIASNKISTLITIKVELSRFLFKDESSGYFVALFELVKNEPLPSQEVKMNNGAILRLMDRTFVGVGTSEEMVNGIIEGQELELWGNLTEGREKNSIQMDVKNIIELMPTHPGSILAFLSSKRIKGLGPKGADEAVRKWGPKTLKVLEETPDMFLEIKRITPDKLEALKASWNEYKLSYDALSRLRSLKIKEADSMKIYKHFGEKCDEIIKKDPYLATEVRGIGFDTADEIARNLGISGESESRIKSGVRYLIQKATNNGDTYLNSLHLLEDALKLLDVGKPVIISALKSLLEDQKVIQKNIEYRYLSDKNTNLYKKYKVQGFTDIKCFKAEFAIAKNLARLIESREAEGPLFDTNDVDEYFDANRDKLDESQLEAVKTILGGGVSALTGGPGTGKTHTIKSLLNFFDVMNRKRQEEGKPVLNYSLAAPTGRAAKRMNETTGRPSSTIHSLLGMNPETGFEFNSANPLPFNIFIIDESSMIDIWIMTSLLNAIPSGAFVILVGDGDQLRPVGPGKVFQDFMDCGLFHVARLKEIHRQARNSQIILAAHSVINNKMPKLFLENSGEKSDSIYIKASGSTEILKEVLNKVKQLLSEGVNPNDIQILTPKKAGEVGVKNMNNELRPLLNKKYALQSYLEAKFVSGDRVMQLKNRKDLDIYNGDIGIVKYYDENNGSIVVIFDGEEVELNNKDMKELDFAYASTIHKSQGSEYPYVIIPIFSGDTAMWDCNLLYTAITRAKNRLYMVGDERTISLSVASFKQVERLTGMKEALAERFEYGEDLDEEMASKEIQMDELDLAYELEESSF